MVGCCEHDKDSSNSIEGRKLPTWVIFSVSRWTVLCGVGWLVNEWNGQEMLFQLLCCTLFFIASPKESSFIIKIETHYEGQVIMCMCE